MSATSRGQRGGTGHDAEASCRKIQCGEAAANSTDGQDQRLDTESDTKAATSMEATATSNQAGLPCISVHKPSWSCLALQAIKSGCGDRLSGHGIHKRQAQMCPSANVLAISTYTVVSVCAGEAKHRSINLAGKARAAFGNLCRRLDCCLRGASASSLMYSSRYSIPQSMCTLQRPQREQPTTEKGKLQLLGSRTIRAALKEG